MRTIIRWVAMSVAFITGLIALFVVVMWIDTSRLPYNSEGRYFDAEANIVHTDAEPQYWAVLGCAAMAVSTTTGLLAWRLRRRR